MRDWWRARQERRANVIPLARGAASEIDAGLSEKVQTGMMKPVGLKCIHIQLLRWANPKSLSPFVERVRSVAVCQCERVSGMRVTTYKGHLVDGIPLEKRLHVVLARIEGSIWQFELGRDRVEGRDSDVDQNDRLGMSINSPTRRSHAMR